MSTTTNPAPRYAYPDPPTGDCEHDNGACWVGPDLWVCDMCGEALEEGGL